MCRPSALRLRKFIALEMALISSKQWKFIGYNVNFLLLFAIVPCGIKNQIIWRPVVVE